MLMRANVASHETRYLIHKRKMLAIEHASDKYGPYLEGSKLVVKFDHNGPKIFFF